MELSEQQEQAFDLYAQRHNVFITGPGGTGKSALIRKIWAHATLNRRTIQVCALTGCAALLLQCKAKTVHSFASIGLGNGDPLDIEEPFKGEFVVQRVHWSDS